MESEEKRGKTIIIPVKKANEKEQRKEEEFVSEGASAEEMEKRWKRALADFDNYRKRCEREMQVIREDERACILAGFLPLLDSLEHAANSCKETEHPIVEGVRNIARQLEQMLRRCGVEEVESEKMIFDPKYHEVIDTVTNPQFPDGFIVDVVQKGYKMGDRLLRPAKVIVVKNYPNNG